MENLALKTSVASLKGLLRELYVKSVRKKSEFGCLFNVLKISEVA